MEELWCYPIKSMLGQRVDAVQIDSTGIVGDRRLAFESSGAPAGKPLLTGRERACMLRYRAAMEEGTVYVQCPGGEVYRGDDPAFVAALQKDLATGSTVRLVETLLPRTECRPIALLARAALDTLSAELGVEADVRRFRANLVLSLDGGIAEHELTGQTLVLGEVATIRVTERTPRCRVVILDPETGVADTALMKHLDRRHGGKIGIYGVPVRPGRVKSGDEVFFLAPDEPGDGRVP